MKSSPETGSRRSSALTRVALRRLRRNKTAMIALGYLIVTALLAIFASLLSPYNPSALVGTPYAGISSAHWLGTDDLGRDVLSRLLYGARLSMIASYVVVFGVMLVATPIGLLSGYLGRWVDGLLMRLMDTVASVPPLVLAMALVGIIGPSLRNAMITIGIVLIPTFTRLVRGQAQSVKHEAFIDAARVSGASGRRIMYRHILPSALRPLVIQASSTLGMVLIFEASLSYLGLGAQPPASSWGLMIAEAYNQVLTHPLGLLPAGGALVLTVAAFNLFGDALREALSQDPPATAERTRLGVTVVAPRAAGPTRSANHSTGALLSVTDLSVGFQTHAGQVTVVDGVSFDVQAAEIVGLVGESGSGKTVTAQAIMRLLPSPPARILAGSVCLDGTDLFGLPLREMAKVRGSVMSMVFQDPLSSLNPAVPVGAQIAQTVRWHEDVSRRQARTRALDMLDRVGVPARRARAYPHEFSGGMRQRVMIAMALVARPKLLIADEPTTALDVTIQAQVLELLKQLRRELDMSIVLVTHDLGVVADACDRVIVMYAGQVVETAPVEDLFHRPHHPYTQGLLHAMPDPESRSQRLFVIPGQVPRFNELPQGCRFAPRCSYAHDMCIAPGATDTVHISNVRCVRVEELSLAGISRRATPAGDSDVKP